MQAIISKYLPATNTRGSRIKATCDRGSITISEEHMPPNLSMSSEEAHRIVVNKLVSRFINEDLARYGVDSKSAFGKKFVTGQLKSGEFVHVFTE